MQVLRRLRCGREKVSQNVSSETLELIVPSTERKGIESMVRERVCIEISVIGCPCTGCFIAECQWNKCESDWSWEPFTH